MTSRRRALRQMAIVACGIAFVCRASIVGAQSVDSVDPGANGTVFAMAVQPDGKILVGGNFATLGGGGTGTTSRPSIGRLNADGTLDMSFNPGTNSRVFALAVQPDGKILIGGDFTTLGDGSPGSPSRFRIGRVSTTGAWDLTFDAGANGNVTAIAVQPDGKILVAGDFTMLGGGGTGTTARNRIGRLNADGTLDSSFNPGADNSIFALALQPDGRVVVGGIFTMLGGGTGTTTRIRIGRLNADGTLDSSFNPGANAEVAALAVQRDGKILAGGQFTGLGGGTGATTRNHIGRLNADGTLDAGFDPGANNFATSFALRLDGKIVLGGGFTTLGGGGTGTTPRNRIGRLNADGSIDTSFDPGANNSVFTVALQPDGKIVAGGDFTTLGGGGAGTATRNRIGRITNADPAPQSLSVTGGGSVVTWTRTGAGPEVGWTTFEKSTNGTTYTMLGSGARVTNGWQLTGQSLPLNQNLFIRARGYYSTGYLNGSGSIVELIQNVKPITGDVDADGRTDRTVFRPGTSDYFFSALSGGGATATGWGAAGDIDVMADYDGDGKADIAVWRPSNGTWYIIQSSNGAVRVVVWGVNGDIPLAGDVDGDGKADQVIYRPSAGGWYFNKSGGGTGFLGWGTSTDQPLLVDFDGDGKADPTIFRPSTGFWYGSLSAGGTKVTGWGTTGDIPVAGDFDGDGKSDVTIFRPGTGQWFVQNSSNGSATVVTWGVSGDIPVSGDWDGDGRSDFTVWRPGGAATWYTQYATGGVAVVGWGTTGDKPIGRRPGS